jgi:NAD+ synthase
MLEINMQVMYGLVEELRKTMEATGTNKAVLGLSGGIDSALSATLAARAIGVENVFAYYLPYKDSAESSRADAQLLADHLGINLETIDITPMAEAYPSFAGLTPHRLGNLLARLRMSVLFDKSAERAALVLGSSNKSELLLGYTTLYGDSASAVNPLGDLYKRQVYQLAELMEVPKELIEKAPSADLIPGQTDEGDIGHTYEEIDELFDVLVEQKIPIDEFKERFDTKLIQSVLGRVADNAYKRAGTRVIWIGQANIGLRTV